MCVSYVLAQRMAVIQSGERNGERETIDQIALCLPLVPIDRRFVPVYSCSQFRETDFLLKQ